MNQGARDVQFLLLAARDTVGNEPLHDQGDDIAYVLKVTRATIHWLQRLQQTAEHAREEMDSNSARVCVQRPEFEAWHIQIPSAKFDRADMEEELGTATAEKIYAALEESQQRYQAYQAVELEEDLARRIEQSSYLNHKGPAEIALTQNDSGPHLEVEPGEEWTRLAELTWTDLLVCKLELSEPDQVPETLMELVARNPERALERLGHPSKRDLNPYLDARRRAQILKKLPQALRQQGIRKLGQKSAPASPSRHHEPRKR